MTGHRLVLFIGALLGALFLYLAVHSLDWHEFAASLARADLRYAALSPIALLTYFIVKAMRWRYLVSPLVRTGTKALLPPVLAGNAGNYLFPHAGEIARVFLAGRRLGVSASPLLASVAIERVFDFLALLLIVFAVLIPAHRMSPEMRTACIFVGTLCAAMLALVVVFLLRTDVCLRLAERALTPFSPRLRASVVGHLGAAGAGMAAIATPGLLLPVLILSILQWLLIVACMALCLLAVAVPVSLASVTSVLLLNVIGLTLPAAPGHVGTVQLSFIVGLAPFGVAQPDAFAGSVVYNVVTVVPTLMLGLPGLRRAWVDLRARFAPD
ncbi:MAG: lysylphosphatidylglycerol synthase transmembrane domain-containing protein [Steroidobacteraceae bacterium]